MTKVFFDDAADLSLLRGKVDGCIGYGHQGCAQSQNLRDNGLEVIIGNVQGPYFEAAKKDRFKVKPIDEVSKEADILMVLISDEAQAEVYKKSIQPYLKKGKILDFAHGYNITFKLVVPPPDVDVVMVAPRMFGEMVRERFVEGLGTPAAIDVFHNASGKAWDMCRALAKGIGATKLPGGGAFEMTFAQEAAIDLFNEQAHWPAVSQIFLIALQVLTEAGYPPELAVMELYGSGEAAEGLKAASEIGFLKHIFAYSSKAAQFGVLTKTPKIMPEERREEIKESMKEILKDINQGVFTREWLADQQKGNALYERLLAEVMNHPINQAELNLKKMFQRE